MDESRRRVGRRASFAAPGSWCGQFLAGRCQYPPPYKRRGFTILGRTMTSMISKSRLRVVALLPLLTGVGFAACSEPSESEGTGSGNGNTGSSNNTTASAVTTGGNTVTTGSNVGSVTSGAVTTGSSGGTPTSSTNGSTTTGVGGGGV